ncbi:zf-HC2 domain-containing protein [Actinoplanes sp. NPDC049598]|uniref:anti-sigma factor family protein n=1 Tax=Actinoplanes sp. NPDC049598 TaxID=3154626 RepID=UPI00342BB969
MSGHETDQLGAYALGVLDDDEWAAVHAHVEGCEDCRREVGELRATEELLGEVPPEAFLDGPPPGGELLLQRTLAQVRDEGNRRERNRRLVWTLAAALAAIAALGGGAWAGRSTAPAAVAAAASPQPPPASAAPPVSGAATNAATGVSMNVTVKPAAGWVRLSASVAGIPAGEQCRLYVVGSGGDRQLAGSWLVSEAAATGGTTVDGSALVAPADLVSVEVETYAGRPLVRVDL